MEQAQYMRCPPLVEYREKAAKRRAVAFCGASEFVCGVRVIPITPRIYSLLYASESRFIFGGLPDEDDVLDFLWYSSPLFVLPSSPEWKKRKRKALAPFMRIIRRPWRRVFGLKSNPAFYAATMAHAVTAIREMVLESFADAPPVTTAGGAPIATLEAEFVHSMASAYHWDPARTSHTPMRELWQLYRCIRRSHGDEIKDREEVAILAAHLRIRNEQLAAERAAKKEAAP